MSPRHPEPPRLKYKYKEGEWRSALVRLTYPREQDRRCRVNVCAPGLLFAGDGEDDAAVDAISPLALFATRLRASVRLTAAARARPPL